MKKISKLPKIWVLLYFLSQYMYQPFLLGAKMEIQKFTSATMIQLLKILQ